MAERAAIARAIRTAVEAEAGQWTPAALADDLDVPVDLLLSIVARELRDACHLARMHSANAYRLVPGPAPVRGLTSLTALDRAILAGLADAGASLTAWELAARIGQDPKAVKRALTRLIVEQRIATKVVRRYRSVEVSARRAARSDAGMLIATAERHQLRFAWPGGDGSADGSES